MAIRKRFEKIGIGPGKPWDASKVDPATLAAIDAGVKEGQAEIDALAAKTFSTNGLFGSRAQLKTNYLQRDVGAMKGLYGNSLEEAWYGGYVCDGSKPAIVHFTKANLPPAKFFWSMTMYTIPDRFLYANPINRYSIGDRTKGLQYGKDGSLTIYVSNASPGKDKESNWLPAPAAKCSLVARVYGPSKAAMSGAWKLPPLEPISPVTLAGTSAARSSSAETTPVTVDNFVRAESDLYFRGILKDSGTVGKFLHRREPARIDNQTVIRLNRDTLYSSAVFDLDAGPVTITLPDAGKRFMSMQVINRGSLCARKFPTARAATPDQRQSRDALCRCRDPHAGRPDEPEGRGRGSRTAGRDQGQPEGIRHASMRRTGTRQARRRFAMRCWYSVRPLPDFKKAFGTKGEVDPVRHLIGSAAGWGGNPDKDAIYLNVTPAEERWHDGLQTRL